MAALEMLEAALPHEPRRIPTVITVAALRVLGFLLVTMVAVATPAIQLELDATAAQSVWIAAGYLLPLCALLLIMGRAGDRFGHRRVAMAGLVTFIVGSLVCAIAGSIELLTLGRILEGTGAAAIVPGLTAMMVWVTPPRARGRTDGLLVGSMMLAIAIGPFIGGTLVAGPGWRAIFWIAAAAALAILPFLAWRCAEPGSDRGMAIGRPAALAWAAGIALILLGATFAAGRAVGSPWIEGTIVAGIAALAVCVVVDRRSEAPYLDDRIVRLGIYLGAIAGAFAYGWIYLGFQVMTLRFLQRSIGLDPAGGGLVLAAALVPVALVAPFAGVLVDRLGHRRPIVAGFLIAAGALAALHLARPDPVSAAGTVAFAVLGAGLGLVLTPLETAAMARMDRRLRGSAAGLLQTARESGGALGVAVLGLAYTATEAAAIARGMASLPDSGDLERPARIAELMSGAPSLVQAVARSDSELSGLLPAIVSGAVADAYLLALLVLAAVAAAAAVAVRLLLPPRTIAARDLPADVVNAAPR